MKLGKPLDCKMLHQISHHICDESLPYFLWITINKTISFDLRDNTYSFINTLNININEIR
jgi:hypothetical protein